MDVTKILAELRQEREQLEEAILSLERLARGRGRRRGRPPAWMVEAKRRGRPPGSKNKTASSASKPTQQQNLWFHGGNLHQSRHYSLFLALQLKARGEGIATPVYGLQQVHHQS